MPLERLSSLRLSEVEASFAAMIYRSNFICGGSEWSPSVRFDYVLPKEVLLDKT